MCTKRLKFFNQKQIYFLRCFKKKKKETQLSLLPFPTIFFSAQIARREGRKNPP